MTDPDRRAYQESRALHALKAIIDNPAYLEFLERKSTPYRLTLATRQARDALEQLEQIAEAEHQQKDNS